MTSDKIQKGSGSVAQANGVLGLQPKLNKYQVVAKTLAGEISKGELTPGTRLESENELAVRFGVSRVTARQALSVLEEQGFISREPGKGTFVRSGANQPARTTGQMRLVAFVVADYSLVDHYTLAEISRAEAWLADKGVAFALAIVKGEDIIAGSLPPVVENGLCDGLIFDLIECNLYMPMFLGTGIPMLAVGNHKLSPRFSCVRFPVERVVEETCDHFAEEYHNPVAFIGGPPDFDIAQEAMIAYLQSMCRLGRRSLCEVFCRASSYSQEYEAEWHDATQEVENVCERVKGPFSLITTAATVQSILVAYRRLGLDAENYPIMTIGVPACLTAEDCARLHIAPLDPELAVETALEKLFKLKNDPNASEQVEIKTQGLLKPGEFAFERLLRWRVNYSRGTITGVANGR